MNQRVSKENKKVETSKDSIGKINSMALKKYFSIYFLTSLLLMQYVAVFFCLQKEVNGRWQSIGFSTGVVRKYNEPMYGWPIPFIAGSSGLNPEHPKGFWKIDSRCAYANFAIFLYYLVFIYESSESLIRYQLKKKGKILKDFPDGKEIWREFFYNVLGPFFILWLIFCSGINGFYFTDLTKYWFFSSMPLFFLLPLPYFLKWYTYKKFSKF